MLTTNGCVLPTALYKFLHTCMRSANEVVNFVARCAVRYSGVNHVQGEMCSFLRERCKVCRLDICQHNPSNFSAFTSKLSEGHIIQHLRMRTQRVLELLMILDGLWSPSDVHFTRSDVRGAITFSLIIVFL